MVGIIKQVTGRYSYGFCAIGVLGIIGGLMILAVRRVRSDAGTSHLPPAKASQA
jgi:MFS-type transporter involved in bile tolerance (Atg22 family)